MSLIYTGVKLTILEIENVRSMAQTAARTPVISFDGTSPDLSQVAWKMVSKQIHSYALAHGLPEIEGYYGCDLGNGEVVRSG